MDNKAIAGILYETADLLEIDGGDSFRIRSYRNAAEAIEAQSQQISELIAAYAERILSIYFEQVGGFVKNSGDRPRVYAPGFPIHTYKKVSSLAVATLRPAFRVARFSADRTFSLLSSKFASGTFIAMPGLA
jgi:hypothetical protein